MSEELDLKEGNYDEENLSPAAKRAVERVKHMKKKEPEPTEEQKKAVEDFRVPQNAWSNIKHVIGVVSGKGGVGKSFVTSQLNTLMNRAGYKTAIMDADITGPSIPKMYGVHGPTYGNENGSFPAEAEDGTKIMSINLLLEHDEDPVIWRGPVIAGAVNQFWTDVLWGDVDYMFVDMPPGTGDVPLTVFQSLPLEGVVIVSSPQDLVAMIVKKAYHMADMMHVPVLGIVENYSYLKCPHCGEKIQVFGESHIDEIASELQVPVLGKLPIDPAIAAKVDAGKAYEIEPQFSPALFSMLTALDKK